LLIFFSLSAPNKKSFKELSGERRRRKKNLLMQSDSQNTSHSFRDEKREAELEQTHTLLL
jgi:hypothetical protein